LNNKSIKDYLKSSKAAKVSKSDTAQSGAGALTRTAVHQYVLVAIGSVGNLASLSLEVIH